MSEDLFRWVVAVAVVLSAVAFVWHAFILMAIYRAVKEAQAAGKELHAKAVPLIERLEVLAESGSQIKIVAVVDRLEALLKSSTQMIEENRPRVAQVSSETLAVAKAARVQADQIGALMDDANRRTKARIAQIDESVGAAITQVEQASGAVKEAVLKPVKEINGLIAGVRAAGAMYKQGGLRHSVEHATQDEEMFI